MRHSRFKNGRNRNSTSHRVSRLSRPSNSAPPRRYLRKGSYADTDDRNTVYSAIAIFACCLSASVFVMTIVSQFEQTNRNFCVDIASKHVCKEDAGVTIPLSKFYPTTYPMVKFPNANAEDTYTIIMLDPDAPSSSNPVYADWIHMIYCNIPGKDLQIGVDETGKTIKVFFGYNPPRPSSGTGRHRYEFLLFLQRNNRKILSLSISHRYGFNRNQFVKQHDLLLVQQTFIVTQRQ